MEQPAQWGLVDKPKHQTRGSDMGNTTICSCAFTPCSHTIGTYGTNSEGQRQQQDELISDLVSSPFALQSTTHLQNGQRGSILEDVASPFGFASDTYNHDIYNNMPFGHPAISTDFSLSTTDPVLLPSDQFGIINPQPLQLGISCMPSGVWTPNNSPFDIYHPSSHAPYSQNAFLQDDFLDIDLDETSSPMLIADSHPLSYTAIFEAPLSISMDASLPQEQFQQYDRSLLEVGQSTLNISQQPPNEFFTPVSVTCAFDLGTDQVHSVTEEPYVNTQNTPSITPSNGAASSRSLEAVEGITSCHKRSIPSVSLEHGIAAEYSNKMPRLIYTLAESPRKILLSSASKNLGVEAGLGNHRSKRLIEENAFSCSRPAKNQKPNDGKPRRTRHLSTQGKKEMLEVRAEGACFRCRSKKYKCDPGKPCMKCIKASQNPKIPTPRCLRQPLEGYLELFFPLRLKSEYSRSAIARLLADNVADGFTENKIDISITSGPVYPPITFSVNEFSPANDEFLSIPVVKLYKSEIDDQSVTYKQDDRQVTYRYAPPYGLTEEATCGLERKWSDHIDAVARGGRYKGERDFGDISKVPWNMFKAVGQYWRSTNNPLVWRALRVYAMHYDIYIMLLLTEESANKAIESLRAPGRLPYQRTLSSKVVNGQIKYVLHMLLRKELGDLLQNLGNAIQSANKAEWAPCFCVVLLLCMCAEMTQVDTDLHAAYAMQTMQETNSTSTLTREESIKQCLGLENGPITHCVTMFHDYMRSFQGKGLRKNQRGYNPLRDGLDGADPAVIALVNQTRRILVKHENEIDMRVKEPSFIASDDDINVVWLDHFKFRDANSGRLVCRYLRSFFLPYHFQSL